MLCLILLLDNEILTLPIHNLLLAYFASPAPAHMEREDEIIPFLNFLPGLPSLPLLPEN